MSSVNSRNIRYSYNPKSVFKALDQNKDGRITGGEIFAYKRKHSLTPNQNDLLSKLLMQMPASMELNGPPPNPLTLKDLQRFAAFSGNKSRLEPGDLP